MGGVIAVNLPSIIASCASGLVVLGILGRWVKKAYDWCQRLGHAVQQVDKRSEQLVPNGGSSMRDEVAAMKKVLAQQSAVMAEQNAVMAEQSAVIADLQQRPRVGIRLRR